jgi:hypothetical protein
MKEKISLPTKTKIAAWWVEKKSDRKNFWKVAT